MLLLLLHGKTVSFLELPGQAIKYEEHSCCHLISLFQIFITNIRFLWIFIPVGQKWALIFPE